jgi:heme/copper-type cytochrome/quinol oxidase subunit 1
MNWEMLSAIGQVVAAVGVIISLIYLAAQIREQNKERRRAGINILTAQWSDLVKNGAGKPGVCRAFSAWHALLPSS